MFLIYDDELDIFLQFERGQEIDLIYYSLNMHYNKYQFDNYEFKNKLHESKKRKFINKKYYTNKKFKF